MFLGLVKSKCLPYMYNIIQISHSRSPGIQKKEVEISDSWWGTFILLSSLSLVLLLWMTDIQQVPSLKKLTFKELKSSTLNSVSSLRIICFTFDIKGLLNRGHLDYRPSYKLIFPLKFSRYSTHYEYTLARKWLAHGFRSKLPQNTFFTIGF